jgi:hypothetical protein
MAWYRIEIQKDGSVASCECVGPSAGDRGGRVFYIESDSETWAIASAISRYKSYLERQRESVQARRESRKSAGLCTECGQPAPDGQRNCNPCLARHRMVVMGTLPDGARQGKVTPRVEELRLVRAGRSQRANILGEVLDAALRMRAGIAFISWLRAERDAAASGEATAAE